MDLNRVIRELYADKERLDQAIAALEELSGSASPRARGGRIAMTPEEKEEIDKRVRKYLVRRRPTGKSQ